MTSRKIDLWGGGLVKRSLVRLGVKINEFMVLMDFHRPCPHLKLIIGL